MIYIFTSATASYLPKVRALGISLAKHHPELSFVLAMADKIPAGFRLEDFKAKAVVSAESLGKSQGWIFQHSIVELSTAIKPFVFKSLFEQSDCDAVIYFDPDMVLYSRLDDLIAHFTKSSILLVPHLTKPDVSSVPENELSTLQYGIYNLGFVGVKNDDNGRRFVTWWADRLERYCFDERDKGLFTDQKWADLVPALFDGVAILKASRFDVASWNAATRDIRRAGDSILVDGEPLGFYHFTGFDSGAHDSALNAAVGPDNPLWTLVKQYHLDIGRPSNVAWAYGYFTNGEPITLEQRRLYRDRIDLQRAFPDPFQADGSWSYYRWFLAEHNVRTVNKYHKAVDRLLPAGTRRRGFYELSLTARRIILREGWHIFFRKSQVYLKSRLSLPPRHQKKSGQDSHYGGATNLKSTSIKPATGRKLYKPAPTRLFGRNVRKKSDTAVILHLYYPEMWEEFYRYLVVLGTDFDLFVSVPATVNMSEKIINEVYPNAYVYRCENKGRDIAPFLDIFSSIFHLNYKYVCKIHSKKSMHRDDGDQWRQDMCLKLLHSAPTIAKIKKALDRPGIGMVAPMGHVLSSERYWGSNKPKVEQLCELAGLKSDNDVFTFAAGSMFWFKPGIFKPVANLPISSADFEPESRQDDGTLAHSLERFFGLMVALRGSKIAEVDSDSLREVPRDQGSTNYPFAP